MRKIRTPGRNATGLRGASLGAACLLALASLTACADDAASTASTGSAGKGDGKGEKVKIMVGGLDKVIYLPAMLTQRLGYFDAEGLDVELLSEPAGVQAETALVSGQVQGAVGFYDHTLDLQVKGKAVESVVQFSRAPGEVEIVATRHEDDITAPKDFRGRKLGVTGLGASTDFLTKFLAVKNGVRTSEFTPVAVGAGPTFVSALQQGSIDAGMTTDPTVATVLAKKAGKVLIDMRTPEGSQAALGGPYPSSSLYMRTDWVDGHKGTVQKLADAFVRTLAWMSTHSASEIADRMPADYSRGNGVLYAAAIKSTLPMFTKDGVMPDNGPETVEKVLKAFNPAVKNADVDLGKTYTTEFVKKAAENPAG